MATRKRSPAKSPRPSTTKEHPDKPGYYHVLHLAKVLDLERRRVEQLANKELDDCPNSENGWLPKDEFIKCYVKFLRSRSQGRGTSEASQASMEVAAERRRKLRRENDLADGILIEFKLVERLVMELVTMLSTTLDGAAGRIAGGDAVLRQRLLREHRRIRDNFANGLQSFGVTVESGGPDTPAAGSNTGTVGRSKKRTTKRQRGTGTV